jgi:cation transport regulator ChaC
MWVFGYGSLMGDGWAVSRRCTRRSLANLSGYSRSFALRSPPVQLDEGGHVEALVPIYEGKNIISVNAAAELKRLIVRARGTSGSGIEYVTGVARELASAGVLDPVVTNLMRDISG